MAVQQYSPKLIRQELWRVFKLLGRPFTRDEFAEVGEIGTRTVERFYGTWSQAIVECGLEAEFLKNQEKERKRADAAVDADWKAKKAELIRRSEGRKVAAIRSQMNKIDLLREMLEETLAKTDPPVVDVAPLKIIKAPQKDKAPPCTLWFEFSDLQLGTLMTSEQMGGLNKHNWAIWQAKLAVWKAAVIAKIRAYFFSHQVDDVVIACLGDMVEGNDIFKGQTWQLDRHVVDQAIQGAADTAAAFIEIMLSFPQLRFHVLEVFGNHGRIGRKGDMPYSCSMDKIYQRMLELHLAKTRIRNLTYHRNEAWFYFVEIYGWNHLLLHGDQGMSSLWSSRPTVNGLEKGITRYNQMLQQQVHFLHCGHFHNEWALSFNMSYMLINGSWIGTSSFSASQMVAASPPMQSVHILEPRVGLAKTERIYLVDGDVKKPIEPHTLKKKTSA